MELRQKSLTEVNKLAQTLKQQERTLHQIVQYILQQHPQYKRLLLVSDQFEELFTLCEEPEAQKQYPNLLFDAVRAGQDEDNHIFSLAITLRADFVGQALAHRPFADALQDNDVKLGPMTREELAQVIEKPAQMHGIHFEPHLVERILDDVGHEPGNLPLLEFALTLLWEKRTSHLLTHVAYEEIGQVEGALARYADEIYNALSPVNQKRARKVFTQMVRPGEGTEDTRRVATQRELDMTDWVLVSYLADQRLVVTGRSLAGERTVEVVHEALIRGWQKLRDWMNEDRAFRTWQERLRTALRQWHASQQDEGALLRGALLAEAEEWLRERGYDLSSTEQHFIADSISLRQRHLTEQEAARQRELETARQLADAQQRRANAEHARAESQALATRRLRILAGGLAIIFFAALGLAVFANGQRQRAETASLARATEVIIRSTAEAQAVNNASLAELREEEALAAQVTAEAERLRADNEANEARRSQDEAETERDRADQQARLALARQLAAQSASLIDNQLDLALLLGIEATNIEETVETNSSLFSALQANPRLTTFLRTSGLVQFVEFSPDGRSVASAGGNAHLSLWDVETGQIIQTFPGHDPQELVNTVVFSPDGQQLASASDDKTVIIWDIETGNPSLPPLREHTGFVQTVAFSPDGQKLASAGGDGDYALHLWDAQTGMLLTEEMVGHLNTVWAIAFSPDGTKLASVSLDQTVRIWDVATRQLIHTLIGHNDGIWSIAFSPDGKRLATGGNNGDETIIIWDVDSGRSIGAPLTGHSAGINSLAFSPDGQHLFSASMDTIILTWYIAAHTQDNPAPQMYSLTGHIGGVVNLDISPDGQQLVSGDMGGDIILWDISPHVWPVVEGASGYQNQVRRVRYHPSGEPLAMAGGANEVGLWWPSQDERITLKHNITVTTPVRTLALSHDEQIAASSTTNGTLLLWEIATGKPITSAYTVYIGGAAALAFSSDDKLVAIGSNFGWKALLEVETGSPPLVGTGLLTGHTDKINGLAFNNDASLLASVSDDGSLIIRDITSTGLELLGKPLTYTNDSGTQLLQVAFSPNGEMVATGDNKGLVTVWDAVARTSLVQWRFSTPISITSVAFNEDNTVLVVGNAHGELVQWHLNSQNLANAAEVTPLTYEGTIHQLMFTGDTLFIVNDEGRISGWDIMTDNQLFGQSPPASTVAVVRGNTAVLGNAEGRLHFWNIEANTLYTPTVVHAATPNNDVLAVAYSPDGRWLVSSSGDGTVNIWDAITNQRVGDPLTGHERSIWDIEFAPDSRHLASVSCYQVSRFGVCTQSQILLWDIETRASQRLIIKSGLSRDLVYSPDGRSLYVNGCATPIDPLNGCLQGAILRLDVTEWTPGETHYATPIQIFTGPTSFIRSLALSPDGLTLAGGEGVATITFWNTVTGEQSGQQITAHTAQIQALAFSPDGSLLASASLDNSILLSDVATGQIVGQQMVRHTNEFVFAVDFHPIIGQLASGGNDGAVFLWEVDPANWYTRACHIANRMLTQAEWQQFFGDIPYNPTC